MISQGRKYKNFKVAVYLTATDLKRISDFAIRKNFEAIEKHIRVDKVYIEALRENVIIDKEMLNGIKSLFEIKGIETSGGMATYRSEDHRFKSLCYSKPEDREMVRSVVKMLTETFDEFIIDDLFFTNCKCEACVRTKGDKSWTQYRLEQMEDISRNIIIKTAREVNPNVRIILKYPNFYDHYQFVGFNLDVQSRIFDMIYTGTETRDPDYTMQHLQEYQSYLIMRLLENTKPGLNGGGWIDPFGRRTLDHYAEQIRLTLLAKPKEVTLFCFGVLLDSVRQSDGTLLPISTLSSIAGKVFEEMDAFLGELGNPYGIASYKPYNSSGEDFLHSYLGMLGLPIEPTPKFPNDSDTILLTECARFDHEIVDKIKEELIKGKNIIITSGLLKAVQEMVLKDLLIVYHTDNKAIVNEFTIFESWLDPSTHVFHSDIPILIPQVKYATNDAWEVITALIRGSGYPMLLQARYANGILHILTIPDNFSDLYHLPSEVLTHLRRILMSRFKFYMEGPSRICMFLYDNDSVVLNSFLPYPSACSIVVKETGVKLQEVRFKFELNGFNRDGETVFHLRMPPYSYMVFKVIKS